MAPQVMTLTPTGVDLSEGLFSTERTRVKNLQNSPWTRYGLKTVGRIVDAASDGDNASVRRARRSAASATPEEVSLAPSPSPVRSGAAAKRRSSTSVRTADVTGYSIVCDGDLQDDKHAEFEVSVHIDSDHWTAQRRFNDFCDLHELLQLQYPHRKSDVSLPPMRYFKTNKFDPAYLERRRRQLDAYMRDVMVHDEFSQSVALRNFISASWLGAGKSSAEGGGGDPGGAPPPAEVAAGAKPSKGMPSMVGMSPLQVKFAVARMRAAQQARTAKPVAAAAAASSPTPTRRVVASANSKQASNTISSTHKVSAVHHPQQLQSAPFPKRVLQLRGEVDIAGLLLPPMSFGTPAFCDSLRFVSAEEFERRAQMPPGAIKTFMLEPEDTAIA